MHTGLRYTALQSRNAVSFTNKPREVSRTKQDRNTMGGTYDTRIHVDDHDDK